VRRVNGAPLRSVRGLMVDVSPLRESRDLRLLMGGLSVSVVGRQITLVAVPYQVYLMTHSSLAVAMLGLVQVIPLVVVSLYSGALADLHDRRRLLLASQVLLAMTSAALALIAVEGHALWPIYVVTAFAAAFSAVESPTRQATVPRLVSRAKLPAAMSLGQVIFQFGQVAGPVAGGLVIAGVGLVWAYVADVATYVLGILAVAAMSPQPPEGKIRGLKLRAPLSGLEYVAARPVLMSVFGADLLAMIFGLPRAIYPAMAATIFRVGPTGLGLLYAAPAVGAFIASLLTGWVTQIHRQGRMVLACVAVWGVAIIGFGLAPWFVAALFFLGVAGAADMLSAVFRNTIIQLSTADAFRGRVSSLYSMVIAGGPRLGDLETGVVATLVSVPFAVVSGGIACLAGLCALALLVPALGRYRYESDADHAVTVGHPEPT
jgi:MFS family permease